MSILTLAILAALIPPAYAQDSSDETLSFSIPERGVWSTTTSGAAASLRTGYGRISPANGSTTPSGVAIFGFRRDGVLITEAGVPASEPVWQGRLFAEVSGSVNTGVAFANPNATPTDVEFYVTDTGGARSAEGRFTLDAHGHIAKFLNDEPFNAGSTVLGTLTFTSTVPVSVIALRALTNEAGEVLITTLPVASFAASPFASPSSDPILFPHFADGSGWVSQVILVNPTASTITGNIEFLGQGTAIAAAAPAVVTLDDGRSGSSFDYAIAPNSAQRFTTSNPAGLLSMGSVRAAPAGGSAAPSGLVVFSFTSGGKTVSEAGVPALAEGTAFRVPVDASGTPNQPGSIRTGLAVANTADVFNTVTLEVTRPDGTQAAPPATITLPPAGQAARMLDEILALPANFSGLLRVSSVFDVSIIALRLRINERGELKMTTTAPANEAARTTSLDRFFAHFADSAGWTTRFILFSGTSGQTASGLVTVTAAGRGLTDSSWVAVLSDYHLALTRGLPERPFVNTTVGGTEGSTKTVGTLWLSLNPDAFPVIVNQGDVTSVLVAASRLGAGRVVAFAGQDFLSPGDRATLLGNPSAARLLANAVRWTGAKSAAPLRVLADNRRVAAALEAQGIGGVEVVGGRGPYIRDWSTDALADADVAVVLANDWGTPRLVAESVAPLRAFAERGGGLVVAASALHWSWWIEQHHGPLTANVLLRDSGISWNEDSIEDIASATTSFDALLLPSVVWAEYIGGGSLDAAQMALLPGVFDDVFELGRTEALDLALTRLARETPPLPVSADAPEARLAAEVARSLGAHEWPETHPWAAAFPGLPAPGARRVNGSVVVDATGGEFPADARRRERHLPLEFYAPPGGLVTISVPSSHATGELQIAVGWEHNDLRPLRDWHPQWRRAPTLRRIFDVTAAETAVTNAYGGSISLVIPESYRGTIPVTVEGAVPMAVYTAGESNAAGWFADLDAGAPQAIIQKPGGIRFVLSAESARRITDPGEVSAWWDRFQRHHAELSGEPVPRAYESIWIFDPQVGYGYANAGWMTINYPLHGEAWVLVPGTAEGRAWLATLPSVGPTPHTVPTTPESYSPAAHGVDWWLFGHELGHQWQTEDWAGHGITEVGVNLFTMYTLNYYIFGGDDFNVYTENRNHGCAATVDHAVLANLRWDTAGHCERLFVYRQLIAEFGWGAMKHVFHSYYDPAYPRSTYGGSLDGFAIRFSAIVQRDLVGFFRHWEYPLSESAAATIRSFGHEEWLPPGW